MSVTPRRSWPAGEGGPNQGSHGGDSQQRHQSQGNMQQTGQHNNRQMGTTNNANSNMSSGLPTSHPETPNKTGPQTQMKPTPHATPQQLQHQQQQQQQHRPLPTNVVNNLPPSTNSLFSPPPATSIQQPMSMTMDIHQHQSNLFVNGQSDMNPSYSGINHGMALNNIKSESNVQASHYEFQSQMNDFDQQQMNSELFNVMTVGDLRFKIQLV